MTVGIAGEQTSGPGDIDQTVVGADELWRRLSIVKQILEAHRGEVWAESKLGKGNCFYFRLDSNMTSP